MRSKYESECVLPVAIIVGVDEECVNDLCYTLFLFNRVYRSCIIGILLL